MFFLFLTPFLKNYEIKFTNILDINFLAVYNSDIEMFKNSRGQIHEKRYSSRLQKDSYKMRMRK